MKVLVCVILMFSLPLWADDHAGSAKLKPSDYGATALSFEDPFWSGVALYREQKWQQAAAKFALSNHPLAHYNLANCYAQMGHFALALETYEQVAPDSPVSADAKFNAQLMEQLLAEDSDNQQKPEQTESSESQDDQQQASEDQSSQSPESASEDETTPSSDGADADADASESGDGGSDEGQNQEQNRDEQSTPTEPEEEPSSPAAGTSENDIEQNTSASGDAELMSEQQLQAQTIEQWLSAIRDEPGRYLRARIEQTMRQRTKDGTLPAPEATAW